MKKLWLMSLIINFSSCAQARLNFNIVDENLKADEYILLQDKLKEVYNKLPEVALSKLSEIKVSIKNLAQSENKKVAGHYKNGIISLSSDLFYFENNQLKMKPITENIILHEIAHAYDLANIQTYDKASTINWCKNNIHLYEHGANAMPEKCILYGNTTTTISSQPDFLSLAGWNISFSSSNFREDRSNFINRSIDTYELKSPSEYFAVNFEAFILDPQYAARKPLMYRYLSSHFKHIPFENQKDQQTYFFISPNNYDASRFLKEIDLKKIYQIHYLLAGDGKNLASKWGHSMFRIVMCAPERKAVGPECLKDIKYHHVLSFRAFIDTPAIDFISGLSGNYPSRLFFLTMNQVIEEYTKTEFRDLYSYPLNLSTEEVVKFVLRSLETHWTYDGKYYFITNNCSTESLNLLRSVITNNSKLSVANINTPKALLQILIKENLTKSEFFLDRSSSINEGFLFPSFFEYYEAAMKEIARYARSETLDIVKWSEIGAQRRKEYFLKSISNLPAKEAYKLASSYSLIELYVQKQFTQKAQLRIAKTLFHDEQKSQFKPIYSALAKASDAFSRPAILFNIQNGYGLPLDFEKTSLQLKLIQTAEIYLENNQKGFEEFTLNYKNDESAELNTIEKNLLLFKSVSANGFN